MELIDEDDRIDLWTIVSSTTSERLLHGPNYCDSCGNLSEVGTYHVYSGQYCFKCYSEKYRAKWN